MQSKNLIGLLLAAGLSRYAMADLVAPVTDVVLFPGGATVVRAVQVGVGASQIVIPGLPANFDVQTLHADSTPGVRIGEIVSKDVAKSEALSPVEADLDAKIQALEDQQAVIDAQIKSAEIVKDYLEHLGGDTGGTDKPRAPLDAKALAGVVDTLGRSSSDALLRIQHLNVQKREIEKKVSALKRDLTHLHSGDTDARTIMVSVVADHAETIKLSYQVYNAGWKPTYRASLDGNTSKLELERMAIISQKTGEDWRDVHLTLSTTQPSLSPTGVSPGPWLLSYRAPEAEPQGSLAELQVAPVYRAMALAPAAPKAVFAPQQDAYLPPTFQTDSTFATEFEVPTRVNLPSDGREVTVSLSKLLLPVKQHLQIAPRVDPNAIVMAEADRPQGAWPSGMVQLFRDNNYVGHTYWHPEAEDKMTLSFGRDELVKVALNPVNDNSGHTGVFDKKNTKSMHDQIVVTNTHKTPIAVEVVEASPVSTASEITVHATFDPKPNTETWHQLRGVVAWDKTIAAKDMASFNLNYEIEYPKTGSTIGLK